MAYSRVMVVFAALRRPVFTATTVVVCNVHLPHLTAKKHPGFANGHRRCWDDLASTIVGHKVRVLAGVFNMSLWLVVGGAAAARGAD